MIESVVKVLRDLNVIRFHYDVRRWDVGNIDDKLWELKYLGKCASHIGRLKDFLEMPYIEDVFGSDDRARNVWMTELARKGRKVDVTYDDLRDVNIFRVNKLNGIYFAESLLLKQYIGQKIDVLEEYKSECNKLLPHRFESGEICEVYRKEYDAMKFEDKKFHVYKIKENVFGFLNCLSSE